MGMGEVQTPAAPALSHCLSHRQHPHTNPTYPARLTKKTIASVPRGAIQIINKQYSKHTASLEACPYSYQPPSTNRDGRGREKLLEPQTLPRALNLVLNRLSKDPARQPSTRALSPVPGGPKGFC